MVKTGGYSKEVVRRELGKNEVSIIDWPPGSRTPAHNHSVSEKTYVLEGVIYSIVDGIKTYYKAGEKILVPVGIVHEVGVDATDGPAKTLNICEGLLMMETFESSDIE